MSADDHTMRGGYRMEYGVYAPERVASANDSAIAELQQQGRIRGEEIARLVLQHWTSGTIPRVAAEAVGTWTSSMLSAFEAEMRIVGFDDHSVRVASNACGNRMREMFAQARAGLAGATESKQ